MQKPITIAFVLAALISCTTQPKLVPPPDILAREIWNLDGAVAAHDPAVIYADGLWYMYYTSYGLRFKTSTDGLSWEDRQAVFGTRPDWVKEYVRIPSSNIWAPDITYYKGLYYLTYSFSSFGKNTSVIGLSTNEVLDPNHPEYRWQHHGPILYSDEDDNYNAIDPDLYFDETGVPWLTFGSFWSGIKIQKLDERTMKPVGSMISLAARPNGGAIEAPKIVKRGKYYYLFVSFDHCCKGVLSDYNIRVGRSESLTGPYYGPDGTPMLEGGGKLLVEGNDHWKGPGHNDVMMENAGSVLFYHAYNARKNGEATLRASPLGWDANDWPLALSAP